MKSEVIGWREKLLMWATLICGLSAFAIDAYCIAVLGDFK